MERSREKKKRNTRLRDLGGRSRDNRDFDCGVRGYGTRSDRGSAYPPWPRSGLRANIRSVVVLNFSNLIDSPLPIRKIEVGELQTSLPGFWHYICRYFQGICGREVPMRRMKGHRG